MMMRKKSDDHRAFMQQLLVVSCTQISALSFHPSWSSTARLLPSRDLAGVDVDLTIISLLYRGDLEGAKIIPRYEVPFAGWNCSYRKLHDHSNFPARTQGKSWYSPLRTEDGTAVSGGGDSEAALKIITLTPDASGNKILTI